MNMSKQRNPLYKAVQDGVVTVVTLSDIVRLQHRHVQTISPRHHYECVQKWPQKAKQLLKIFTREHPGEAISHGFYFVFIWFAVFGAQGVRQCNPLCWMEGQDNPGFSRENIKNMEESWRIMEKWRIYCSFATIAQFEAQRSFWLAQRASLRNPKGCFRIGESQFHRTCFFGVCFCLIYNLNHPW